MWLRSSGLWHCAAGWVVPHIFKEHCAFTVIGQAVQDCLTFEALGTTHQLTCHHISENLNPLKNHQSENFKFRRFLCLSYRYMFIKLNGVMFQKKLLIMQHIHDRCSVMHQVELWVSFCQIIISLSSYRRTVNM